MEFVLEEQKALKISVKTLDKIIIGCLAVIIILVALDLRNPGFTITFDSRGWYLDTACQELWDVEEDIIEGDITLYAGWEKE